MQGTNQYLRTRKPIFPPYPSMEYAETWYCRRVCHLYLLPAALFFGRYNAAAGRWHPTCIKAALGLTTNQTIAVASAAGRVRSRPTGRRAVMQVAKPIGQ